MRGGASLTPFRLPYGFSERGSRQGRCREDAFFFVCCRLLARLVLTNAEPCFRVSQLRCLFSCDTATASMVFVVAKLGSLYRHRVPLITRCVFCVLWRFDCVALRVPPGWKFSRFLFLSSPKAVFGRFRVLSVFCFFSVTSAPGCCATASVRGRRGRKQQKEQKRTERGNTAGLCLEELSNAQWFHRVACALSV